MRTIFTFLCCCVLFTISTFSQNWVRQYPGTNSTIMDMYFLNADTGWISTDGSYIHKTTDGGISWQLTFIGGQGGPIFFVDKNIGFHGRTSETIFRTSDGGSTWNQVFSYTFPYIQDIYFPSHDTGFATLGGTNTTFVLKTTDCGLTWNSCLSAASYESLPVVKFVNNKVGFVLGSYGLYKTIDGGLNWSTISLQGSYKRAMDFVDSLTGWYSTSSGIRKTTDGGLTWVLQNTPTTESFYKLQFIDQQRGWGITSNIISNTFFYTTNGGTNWISCFSDPSYILSSIFFVNNDVGWIGCSGGALYKTTDGGIPVELTSFTAQVTKGEVILSWSTSTETNNHGFEIERKNTGQSWQTISFKRGAGTTTDPRTYSFTDKPSQSGRYNYRLKQTDLDGRYKYSSTVEINLSTKGYNLEQNYPNPFNPTTVIKYEVGEPGFVSLIVYNALGEEINSLVYEQKEAGIYTAELRGESLPAGIYFCRLKVNDFSSSIKMSLLK